MSIATICPMRIGSVFEGELLGQRIVVPKPDGDSFIRREELASKAFYLDLLADPNTYYVELEERRHLGAGTSSRFGQSNYAWLDGGVRAMHFGKTTCPINLWAATDKWRTKRAFAGRVDKMRFIESRPAPLSFQTPSV